MKISIEGNSQELKNFFTSENEEHENIKAMKLNTREELDNFLKKIMKGE